MEAFLFYVDDWLSSKKVQAMDAHEERGYLRLLLFEAKEPDCGLPANPALLAIISMLGTGWNKATQTKAYRVPGMSSGEKILQCFEYKPESAAVDRLYNERLYKEWRHQQKVRAERRSAGEIGASKRAANAKANAISKAELLPQQTGQQNGANEGLGFVGLEYPSFGKDDSFIPFVEAYVSTGKQLIPEDFISAHWLWRKLDFEAKLLSVSGIYERIKKGVWSDPAFVMIPKNYLGGEFKRPVVARGQGAARRSVMDGVEL